MEIGRKPDLNLLKANGAVKRTPRWEEKHSRGGEGKVPDETKSRGDPGDRGGVHSPLAGPGWNRRGVDVTDAIRHLSQRVIKCFELITVGVLN